MPFSREVLLKWGLMSEVCECFFFKEKQNVARLEMVFSINKLTKDVCCCVCLCCNLSLHFWVCARPLITCRCILIVKFRLPCIEIDCVVVHLFSLHCVFKSNVHTLCPYLIQCCCSHSHLFLFNLLLL